MQYAGHATWLASRLRSWDGAGCVVFQHRVRDVADRVTRKVVQHIERQPIATRPDLWFTYHVYHKAPDWIGPRVSAQLGIPYVIAEASYAPKQKHGPWDLGHRQAESAIRSARAVLTLNPADIPAVTPLLSSNASMTTIDPFLDVTSIDAQRQRTGSRTVLAEAHNLDPDQPWLVAVAMMRHGDKLASYRLLAQSLSTLLDLDWQVLLIGDGPAHDAVEHAFAPLAARTRWIGQQSSAAVLELLDGADIFVWPAINEAYGMALLEAQACGTPIVAARSGGVESIVVDNETGLLVEQDDASALASAVRSLLNDALLRDRLGANAHTKIRRQHDLSTAATQIDRTLQAVLKAVSQGSG
jgi:glycosyltransferase involved in cell wall biosynthesis